MDEKSKKIKEFWITNISNSDISLSDLNATIRAKTSVNLLGRRYSLTEEQVQKSWEIGSMSKRQGKLFKRQTPPSKKVIPQVEINDNPKMIKHQKSTLYAEEVKYEELNIPDTEFAEENSDLAEQDHLWKYKK